ncbi:MAG: hypothetical protein NVSMB23_25690 [Myxococcales bacterium]
MTRRSSNGPFEGKPSRRDSLRLLAAALVAPALLPAEGRAQDAGPAAAAPAPRPQQDAAATPPAWPTTEKLQKTNQENVAALKKVALANGDAPDLLPHPPTRARSGAAR